MTRALCLSLAATLSMSLEAADWEALPPLPEPNGGGLCGVVGGKIVVVGGTNWVGGTKNWLRSVCEYDPERRVWTKREDWEGGPVAYGIGFQHAGEFRFIGGSDGTRALKILATVDGTQPRLQSVPELPAALVLASGGAVGGRIIVGGGTDDAANVAGVQRTTHVVEFVDPHWKVTRMADFPGPSFAVAASAVVDDELFLFGGMHWDAATAAVVNSRGASAFSPARNSWRKLKPLAIATRGLCGVPLDGQRIYLAGGYADSFSAAASIYDVKADSYQPATPLPYAAMVSLVRSGDFLYCLGGEDKMKARTDKFFRIPVAELLR